MNDIYVKELRKNNFKKNILFSISLPILLFLKYHFLETLPITIASNLIPMVTIIILATMGVKLLSNIVKAIKYYKKAKKTSDNEYQKILKEKGLGNVKGIIYLFILTLCMFFKDYVDLYFTSNIAASISTLSTLTFISLVIGSIACNTIEIVYNKKKIKELKNNSKEIKEVKIINDKRKDKLKALKKEIELYNNQLKNTNIDYELQKKNVKRLKKW